MPKGFVDDPGETGAPPPFRRRSVVEVAFHCVLRRNPCPSVGRRGDALRIGHREPSCRKIRSLEWGTVRRRVPEPVPRSPRHRFTAGRRAPARASSRPQPRIRAEPGKGFPGLVPGGGPGHGDGANGDGGRTAALPPDWSRPRGPGPRGPLGPDRPRVSRRAIEPPRLPPTPPRKGRGFRFPRHPPPGLHLVHRGGAESDTAPGSARPRRSQPPVRAPERRSGARTGL